MARLLERILVAHRDAPAVVHGATSMTYGELDDRSRRLAGALSNVRPGQRPVAIYAHNCVAWAEFDVACARAGFTRLGLNARLHPAEVADILRRFDAAALVTTAAALREFAPDVVEGRFVLVLDDGCGGASGPVAGVGYDAALADDHAPWTPGDVEPERPYLVALTSGTTGSPKGAIHDQGNRAHALRNLQAVCGISAESRSLHFLSMSNASLPVMAVFVAGGCNVIADDTDARALADLVREHAITHLTAVPLVAERIVELRRSEPSAFEGLQSVVVFGAPAMPELLRAAFDMFGDAFVYAYGSTEAPMPVTALTAELRSVPRVPDDQTLASAGRAAGSWELRIRDAGPTPGVGELLVRGPGLMVGYWNDPDSTAEVFDAEGFYATGDLAEIDGDGLVYIRGRLRDFILTGGYNVYPAEVEQRLRAHPQIVDAAVVGVPDPAWGEMVAAAVVVRERSVDELTAADVVAWVRNGLAGYKKPRRIAFVEELPRSPFGKVRKGNLRQRFQRDSEFGAFEEGSV